MTITLQAVNELIQSLESAGELSIKETKVLALAKAYQQLGAENLTMNRLLNDISDNHVEYFSEGEGYMFAGVPLDYVSEINMYVSRDVNAENPFPATDRIVAGIKADGATAAGDYLKLNAQHMPVVERLMMQDAAEICYGTAARLREGAK
ncbi:hypothetical protein A4T49_12835 [Klebsiella pneumoniae]|uniref:hypothetical protein n=1 Tax=Klebsiella pneumoniae TaxID=573 RepID=UPI0009F8F304|nr:hypothetical protein [Klebsiella pneumoniae]ORD42013.1 hypothetical protein A4T45_15315 [Klebsiella pneumoniae]ORD56078.1 hypothetical protein A4T49_12835 [Klebsiella pneumoniae]ORD77821.1 hypothetical protein A4T51_11800 [Klebsiella pneumoniae]